MVSHYQTSSVLKHVTNALELADLQYETIDRAERAMDKTLSAMKRCDAGVIVVAEESVGDDLLLIQIGAALVQYEERVLVVVKEGISVPVGNASVCEIANEFTWSAGLELVRSLKRVADLHG